MLDTLKKVTKNAPIMLIIQRLFSLIVTFQQGAIATEMGFLV